MNGQILDRALGNARNDAGRHRRRELARRQRGAAFGGDVGHQVDNAIGVSPLVIIPAKYFGEGAVDDVRALGVKNTALGIADEVSGDERLFAILEIFAEAAWRPLFVGGIDFFFRRGFFELDRKIDDRNVRSRNADGNAVHLAFQFRNHEADRLGGAGRGRNHGERGRAGAPQVLMREVLDDLIVRIGMDRGHQAALNAEGFADDFGQRGQAVRGAGGVGDDRVLRGIKFFLVDAHADRDVFPFGGSGNDDAFGAGRDMRFGFIRIREAAGGFDDDVDAQVFPRQLRGILLRDDFDGLAVNDNVGAFGFDFMRVDAENGVIFIEVRERLAHPSNR